MRKVLFLSLTILLNLSAQAGEFIPLQKSRAIIGLGTSLYYGDINESFSSATKSMGVATSIGIQIHAMGKWYFTPSLSVGNLFGDDALAENPWRNLSFNTSFTQLSTDILYAPTDYHEYNRRGVNIHPILGIGGGLLFFNPRTRYNDELVNLQPLSTEGVAYARFTPTINLKTGFVWRINENIETMISYDYRYTFTDYIDDISGAYIENESLIGDAAILADRSFEGGVTPTASLDGEHWEDGYQRGTEKGNDSFGLIQLQIGFTLN